MRTTVGANLNRALPSHRFHIRPGANLPRVVFNEISARSPSKVLLVLLEKGIISVKTEPD